MQDIFSSAEATFPNLNTANHFPLHSTHSSSTSPTESHSNTATKPVATDSPIAPTHKSPLTHPSNISCQKSFSPSSLSVEKLKSFVFKKRPSPQKGQESASGLGPTAAKRVNPLTRQSEECDDVFDKDLLDAFLSEPEETEQQQSSNVLGYPTSIPQEAGRGQTSSTSQFSFKAPKSCPRKSGNTCFSSDKVNHQRHLTQNSTPSTPQSQPITSSSTAIFTQSPGPRSTPNHHSLCRGSSTPRTSLPRSSSSALSTPQWPQSGPPVKRRFPGPAGILPPLVSLFL